ncbi:lipopolysaccharide transport system ATP-binding protein [Aquipseudomonas alcaligenes]|uniref:ABC transporter ATP-binding protein n=1 Tax=Aquipseudomonas alcaligenes TaxID=43263 RepID=UPI0009572BAB|nr:ABC transporter ATP-binding protein [Pseudomonas alcaligenes]SIS13252.1 lipopolysaccharide transport system ATP-binding protein [Pseudomonas alcaligenes]
MTHTASPIIQLQQLSKIYRTYSTPRHRLLELLSAGRKRYAQEVRALEDISFNLDRGSRLGIVGQNGSGKSTLLKILSGVLTPSSGSVKVDGRVSALLELGAGFNPLLPGRENIRQYGLLHGMSREEIEAALPQIIAFSELREAIEQPVRTYSSGMAVRLGFACAVYVRPEILIVDEALSVGDAYFQNKCLHKIKSLLDDGTTFIYVTHAADSIRGLCEQGLWLDQGRMRLMSTSKAVGEAYQKAVFERMTRSVGDDQSLLRRASKPTAALSEAQVARRAAFAERVAPLRSGSGEAKVIDIVLRDEQGAETDGIVFRHKCTVQVLYRIDRPLPDSCAVTLGILDRNGSQVMHFNSAEQGVYLSEGDEKALQMIQFEFTTPLCPGEFGLVAGISTFVANPSNNGQLILETVIDACIGGARFAIHYPNTELINLWGLVHAPCTVSAHPCN